MNEINMMYLYTGVFVFSVVIIWLEARFGYPFGVYDGMVWCIIPPFLKRIRIFGYWVGFSSKWRFLFFKKGDYRFYDNDDHDSKSSPNTPKGL